MIQIYTGNGKGKSTAAVGQAARAAGHGLRVAWVSFFKGAEASPYGEFESFRRIGVEVFHFATKHPHFYENLSPDEVRRECLKGIEFVRTLFRQGRWDMLVLDEINIALRDGFLKENEVVQLLDEKPQNLELILTGRGATKKVMSKADLVSEVKKVKHPYDTGIGSRKGIDY